MKIHRYPVVVAFNDDGSQYTYVARFVDFRRSCVAGGRTPEEAMTILYELGQTLLEELERSGFKVPEPTDIMKKLESEWEKPIT